MGGNQGTTIMRRYMGAKKMRLGSGGAPASAAPTPDDGVVGDLVDRHLPGIMDEMQWPFTADVTRGIIENLAEVFGPTKEGGMTPDADDKDRVHETEGDEYLKGITDRDDPDEVGAAEADRHEMEDPSGLDHSPLKELDRIADKAVDELLGDDKVVEAIDKIADDLVEGLGDKVVNLTDEVMGAMKADKLGGDLPDPDYPEPLSTDEGNRAGKVITTNIGLTQALIWAGRGGIDGYTGADMPEADARRRVVSTMREVANDFERGEG